MNIVHYPTDDNYNILQFLKEQAENARRQDYDENDNYYEDDNPTDLTDLREEYVD